MAGTRASANFSPAATEFRAKAEETVAAAYPRLPRDSWQFKDLVRNCAYIDQAFAKSRPQFTRLTPTALGHRVDDYLEAAE